MNSTVKISDYDYPLPEERIARFPVADRGDSRLLVYRGGTVDSKKFSDLETELPPGALLVFNNTRVIRARIIMQKESGARIEVFCLEPHNPADYERAFAVKGSCEWRCMVGNSKKWKEGPLVIRFFPEGREERLTASRVSARDKDWIIRFEWDANLTFGQVLEHLGKIPIPPYLGRESEEIDYDRYQTVYSKIEGSVAAPTAGLHFSAPLMERLRAEGHKLAEVTLHVGAGTFLPVKADNVTEHEMHTEHFSVTRELVRDLLDKKSQTVAVGTTTVRTLESLPVLGARILTDGRLCPERAVGQWEAYGVPENYTGEALLSALHNYMVSNDLEKLETSTRIMIMPGFRFRVADAVITNFHQPKSTLLLLVSAFVGEAWRDIYDYALENGFRFLSYGDSSILFPQRK